MLLSTLIFCSLLAGLAGCEPDSGRIMPEAGEVGGLTATPDATPTTDRLFVPGERVGAIRPGMSANQIRDVYGPKQFVAATLYGPEGITFPGYRLFPGTDDELSVMVEDSMFTAYTSDVGGRWAVAGTGVRVGTSLGQLNRLNGGPFEFSGFGWDYGGNVTDWRGGALAGYALSLDYDYNLIDSDHPFMRYAVGDTTVESADERLTDADVRVSVLRLYVEL